MNKLTLNQYFSTRLRTQRASTAGKKNHKLKQKIKMEQTELKKTPGRSSFTAKPEMLATIFLMLVSFFAFGSRVNGQGAENLFYYAFDEKIYLSEVRDKAIVRFKQATDSSSAARSIRSYLQGPFSFTVDRIDNSTYYILSANSDIIMETLELRPEVASVNPVLKTVAENTELGTTNEFVAGFLPEVTAETIEKINTRYGVTIVKTELTHILLAVPDRSDVLAIANAYQESGLVKFSHPNFIAEVKQQSVFPNDQFFNFQFPLHNTGQLINDGHFGTNDADVDGPEAWCITKGSPNIVIAVLDEGVTDNHTDLPSSRQVRLTGSNSAAPYDLSNPNDPSPAGNGNHGNACAGIIAATLGNSEGVAGIAPKCKIMPVRIPFGNIPSDVYANAINFAASGADILSNSWGYNNSNPNLFPVIVTAISNAATTGRSGKGAIVVFAAGNTAHHAGSNNGYVTFPGSCLVPSVITVGASDRNDKQANYSPSSNAGSGQTVDVVAPSHKAYPNQIPGENFEVWSMDIPGTPGYNNSNGETLPNAGTNYLSYTGRMGGTSAATPLVSGIAGLVLTMKNSLTAQEVFDLIRTQADKVGGYNYVNGISNEMGAGRVNAHRSVAAASGVSVCCSNSLIDNYHFAQSPVSGDLQPNGAGRADPWFSSYATPQVVTTAGCNDSGYVRFWGHQTNGEVLSQSGLSIVQGRTYQICICIRRTTNSGASYGRIGVTFTNGNSTSYPPSPGSYNGGIIGGGAPTTPPIAPPGITSTNWVTYCYSWTAMNNFNTINLNPLNDFSGGPETVSWMDVDNVCITEVPVVNPACTQNCTVSQLNLSTGYDRVTNSLYPNESYDAKWKLVLSPLTGLNVPRPAAVVSNQAPGSWTDMSGSKWLNPLLVAHAPGGAGYPNNPEPQAAYEFETQFCICDNNSLVNLNFSVLADDSAGIYLDGIPIPVVNGPINYVTPRVINHLVVLNAGVHRLKLRMRNLGGSPLGVNLSGGITGSNIKSPGCCDSTSCITGVKFFDYNRNGVKESNEPLMKNWPIYLNGSSTPLYTDSYGQYTFCSLNGSQVHTVREGLKWFWRNSTPLLHAFYLPSSSVVRRDFGNYKRIRFDWLTQAAPKSLYDGKVTAILRRGSLPHDIVDSGTAYLDSSGLFTPMFTQNLTNGFYYLGISGNNFIESYSVRVNLDSASEFVYDFTSSQSQTLGGNSILVNGKWCFYLGDVNQDDVVDLADLGSIDNDANNFTSGYVPTDLNGDNFVDVYDVLIADNNASNFVGAIKP